MHTETYLTDGPSCTARPVTVPLKTASASRRLTLPLSLSAPVSAGSARNNGQRSVRLVASTRGGCRSRPLSARIITPAYLPQTAVSCLSPVAGSNAPCSCCSRKTLLTLRAAAALAFLRHGVVVFKLAFCGFDAPKLFLSTTNTIAPQQRYPRKHHLKGCHKRQSGYLIHFLNCLYCDLCSRSWQGGREITYTIFTEKDACDSKADSDFLVTA